MKARSILFYILILCPYLSFATKVDKGFRALEKSNFEKAADFFHETLNENNVSSAANYGLARVYGNELSKLYNLDQAYNHVAVAKEQFDSKKADNKSDLKDQGISFNDILKYKIELEDRLLQIYVDSNTVSALTTYIETFDDAENKAYAINLRNQLAYSLAKLKNTIGALQNFINEYPESAQLQSAIMSRDKRAYDSVIKVNTLDAFVYFSENYPDAIQAELIEERRNELAYVDLLEKKNRLISLESERVQLLREKEEREKTLIKKENKMHSQRNLILMIALGITGIMLVVIIAGYIQKRKINQKISHQKETIEVKNNQIVDSINYAKRIQEAILPDPNEIKKHFTDSFVFYKPRDIVSGDFYWFEETADKVYIAAVDCTGHGVPGAFMSMIGNTLLNQTVHVKGNARPSDILNDLRKEIIKALKQTGADDEAKDGMDMALVAFSKDKTKVEFSGAFNPLYMIRKGELEQLRGDRQPISSYFGKDKNPFTNHELELEKEDSVYIFTDGFADQFGGAQEKKFSYKKLRELLVAIHKDPAPKQKQRLESEMSNWMRGYDQVDDMLIIGIKV